MLTIRQHIHGSSYARPSCSGPITSASTFNKTSFAWVSGSNGIVAAALQGRRLLVGKTEKTVVLPRFDGTECKGGGSSGAMTLHLSFQPKVCGGTPEQYTPMPFYARGSLTLACSLLLLPYVLFFGFGRKLCTLTLETYVNLSMYVTIITRTVYSNSERSEQYLVTIIGVLKFISMFIVFF